MVDGGNRSRVFQKYYEILRNAKYEQQEVVIRNTAGYMHLPAPCSDSATLFLAFTPSASSPIGVPSRDDSTTLRGR